MDCSTPGAAGDAFVERLSRARADLGGTVFPVRLERTRPLRVPHPAPAPGRARVGEAGHGAALRR